MSAGHGFSEQAAASTPLVAIPVYDAPLPTALPLLNEFEPRRSLLTVVQVVPWLSSLFVHFTLVLMLGLWMVAQPVRREVMLVTATIEPPPPPVGVPQVKIDNPGPSAPPTIGPTMRMTSGESAPNQIAPPKSPPRSTSRNVKPLQLARADAPQYAPQNELMAVVDKAANLLTPFGKPQREPSSPAGGGIMAVPNPGDAADKVLSSISREFADGNLLVVWLLDASLSLYEDRQVVAAKMDPFYRDIQAKQGQPSVLMSAAVAFGADVKELQKPTRYGVRLVKTTSQEVPIDPTGIENTMSAVEWCVQHYRKSWKDPMLIVIWTDESGDDTLRLEDTIAYCRQQGVVVTVVGPTAVFGAEGGYAPYVDRPTGYSFLLPVKRGPDTSLPERIPLPYWHESLLPPPVVQGAQVNVGMPWYGGAYREGVMSGIGPYALTRLALETGGQFLQLDKPGEQPVFQFEQMKNHLPDYGSAAQYLRNLQYHPLRAAVLNSVQLAWREQAKLTVPRMSFVSYREPFYPFSIYHKYVSPAEFRADLKTEFAVEARFVLAANLVVEQALAMFGPHGMEELYGREESPRWKAWYDLTRGRLLATSVRQAEYLHACKLILERQNFLNPNTNHIEFVPSDRLLSQDEIIRARITEAVRLLKRCVEKNPGTPWAMLAQWELDRAAGMDIQQIVIPPPQPPPAVPLTPAAPVGAPAPVPTLPRF